MTWGTTTQTKKQLFLADAGTPVAEFDDSDLADRVARTPERRRRRACGSTRGGPQWPPARRARPSWHGAVYIERGCGPPTPCTFSAADRTCPGPAHAPRLSYIDSP